MCKWTIPSQTPVVPPLVLELEAPPNPAVTDASNSANTCSPRLMLLRQSIPILGTTKPSLIEMPLKHVTTRPDRQQGCEEYELLSHLDKIEVYLYPFKFSPF